MDPEDPNAYAPDGPYADGALGIPPADEADDLESDPTLDHSRIFGRAQVALTKALETEFQKNSFVNLEKEKEVKVGQQKREQIGVELYGLQQQLAKQQMFLERTHEKHTSTQAARSEAEQSLVSAKQVFTNKKTEHAAMQARVAKSQKELDAMLVMLRQVDEYSEKMQSEIAVTKRIAYGAEEDIRKAEAKKSAQDLLIDSLNEQVKSLSEQIALTQAHIGAQKNETSAAAAMLKEANDEMHLITVEKKEYMQKWKSSLIAMSRRDEALSAAETALREQNENMQTLRQEIDGFKSSVRLEQEKNERLTSVMNKLSAELSFVSQQQHEVDTRTKKLSNEMNTLRQAIEKHELELKQTKIAEGETRKEVIIVEKLTLKIAQDHTTMQQKHLDTLSQQTTLEKGAQNVLKEAQKLRELIAEKEQKLADIQNEIARIKVDSLNTAAHNKELRATYDECVKELKEKESLIVKYETEIHQRMDEIEKKQIYVDRLNRKYDALTQGQTEENLGPLEATIKSMEKEITSSARESAESQRVWIKGQTELVELHATIEERQTAISTLSAQRTALEQKMLRSTAGAKQQQTETRELGAAMRVLRTDFQRLNELIARNVALHEQLTNAIVNAESDFSDRLREQQRECESMDAQIAASRDAKKQLLEDILEAERQVMLWEKKITLEKEAQAMLDPEYGQAEVAGMKKEIHRMEYRLRQLKRKQEEMMQEMELAIEKREIIETKNSLTKSKTVTQATIKQRTLALRQALKQSQTEMRTVDAEIARQESDNQMLAEQLERMQSEYNRIEDIKFDVAAKLDEKFLQKQMNVERLQMLQKRVKRYDAALQDSYNVSGARDELAGSLEKSILRAARLKSVFEKLRDNNPKYEQFFDHLLAFCNE